MLGTQLYGVMAKKVRQVWGEDKPVTERSVTFAMDTKEDCGNSRHH
jgi:hypothetical protein